MFKFGRLRPSPLSANHDARPSQTASSQSPPETGDDDSHASDSSGGLGINFYNHGGSGRRSTRVDTREANEQADYEATAVLSQLNSVPKSDPGASAIHTPKPPPPPPPQPKPTPTPKLKPKPTPKHIPLDSPSSIYSSGEGTPRLASFDAQLEPELRKSPSVLLDELLEENLRGRAEDFVRIASRGTPVRVLSTAAAHTPRSSGGGRSASAPLQLLVYQGLGIGGAGAARVLETGHLDTLTSPRPDNLSLNLNLNHNHPHSQFRPLNTSSPQRSRLRGSINLPLVAAVSRPRNQSVSELNTSHLRGSGFSPHHRNRNSSPLQSPDSPGFAFSASAFKNRLRIPIHSKPSPVQVQQRRDRTLTLSAIRGPAWFTPEERQLITELVFAADVSCAHHVNCRTCVEQAFAYHENNALPETMDPEQRQKIINQNRSLRNIKNELEALAETGAISDEAYDTIMAALPQESPLSRSAPGPAPAPAPVPAAAPPPPPAAAAAPDPVPAAIPTPSPIPTAAFNALHVSADPPPPAYTTPLLPSRGPSAPPPPKPEIARATALYRYGEPGDCNFEAGDQIAVHEYMNADWWLGRNLRTGKEGVFPVNYVQVQPPPQQMNAYGGAYGNEKQGYQHQPPYQQQQQQQYAGAPGPSHPYDSSVPPMAIAEQPTNGSGGKGAEMGKRFGKKLGNAAIFGAGATIGGNIVNSIL